MTPLWAIPALAYLCFVQGQSVCNNPRGQKGECKSIYDCDSLRTLVNKPGKTQDEVNFLQKSGCGFNGLTPLVCCPNSAPPKTTSCSTPEGNQGQCISIFNCEHIAKRLESPIVSQEDRNYVTSLRCDGPGYSVCCGPPVPPTPATPPPTPPTPRPTTPASLPLTVATPSPLPLPSAGCVSSAELPNPATECCGIDGVGANKITGGNATGIDQYPWLVLIEYIKAGQGKIKLLCGGVLISGRYVLTAGHCVAGPVLNSGTPTNVRLGEYDTSNSGPDCVSVEGGDEGDVDCSPEPVVIPIERVITHPNYQPRSTLRRNDIALLRLKQTAPYTDFIRPICLPTKDVTLNFPEEDKLFAAGWGAVNETISASSVKLHVDLPYKTLQECQPAYTSPSRAVRLWGGHICAGGEPGKDSCKGDSGGPLMYTNGTIYDVVGIVSFGPTPCGLNNVPGVYTKVFEYLTWIRSNIVA